MDPASASELRDILTSSNIRMEQQEEQIMATGRAVQGTGNTGLGVNHSVPTVKIESTQQAHCAQPPTVPSVDYIS